MAKGQDMFGFQSVMKDYYGYKPDSDDDTGRENKRAFQSNMIQSAFDTQLAMQQAEQATSLDIRTREAAARLELANQTALMKDTFTYGMEKMGAEYDYQSRFAVDDAARELDRMAAAGDITQNQTRLENTENRLTLEQQGRQNLQTLEKKGETDIEAIKATGQATLDQVGAQSVADQAAINVQADANVRQIETQGAETRKTAETAGDQDRKSIAAKGATDVASIQASGTEQRSTIGTQGEQNRLTIGSQGEQDRLTVGTTAEEGRETLREQNRLTAKDRANQRSFASDLAAR